MSEELKPCPFCGGDNVQVASSGIWTGQRIRPTKYFIDHICRDGVMLNIFATTEETCIARWNNRESGMEQTNNGSAE